MNHRLIERWLLEGAILNGNQKRLLQEHLKTCTACNRLACNLTRLEHKFNSVTEMTPRAGFAHRFQASLPIRQAVRQRRQLWMIAASGLSVGAAVYLYSILPELSRLSVGSILSGLVMNSLSLAASLLHIRQISSFIMMGIPPTIPLAIWVSLTTVFTILSLIWVLALGRILAPKGEQA